MLCVFIFIFGISSGPIAWVYATETCCDVSLGVAVLTLWSTVLVLSLTSESLMNSALQPQGVFFLFAVFSMIATFFVYFYMGETKGLTEKKKKALFIPGGKYGRRLRPGEEMMEMNES